MSKRWDITSPGLMIWLSLGDNAVLDAEPFPNREAFKPRSSLLPGDEPVVVLTTLHFSLCPAFQSDLWHSAELVNDNRENKWNKFKKQMQ